MHSTHKILAFMILLFAALLLPLFHQALAETADTIYTSYQELEKVVLELEDQSKYDEAIILLEKYYDKFPDDYFTLTKELLYLYKKIENYNQCLDVWRDGHAEGYFYNINLRSPRCEMFRELEGIEQIAARDKELRDSANKISKTIYEIEYPDNYSSDKSYPVLIVFHGGARSIDRARQVWHSDLLSEQFIVVYMQSFMHYDSDSYSWPTGNPRLTGDINKNYKEITANNLIDKNHIYIGGMSNGGSQIIHIAINDIIPINGFIGVCPGKPRDFDVEKVGQIVKRGVKGYILSGENDFFLERQNEMVDIFKQEDLQHKFEIIPGMDHRYPDDFSERLDDILKYLMDGKN